MSARRGEAYYTSKIAKNVLSERADIMNYVPTKAIPLFVKNNSHAELTYNYMPNPSSSKVVNEKSEQGFYVEKLRSLSCM